MLSGLEAQRADDAREGPHRLNAENAATEARLLDSVVYRVVSTCIAKQASEEDDAVPAAPTEDSAQSRIAAADAYPERRWRRHLALLQPPLSPPMHPYRGC